CHTQDNAIVVEDDFLGLTQNRCVCRSGFGWTVFGDGSAVALRINAGATGKNESRAWETSSEIGCAVAIDMAIRISAGTSAMHDHVGGEAIAADGFQISDVHRRERDSTFHWWFGRLSASRPANDLPSFLCKSPGRGAPDIT